jgi:hypothetical protein
MPLVIFDDHSAHFVFICYILSRFGMLFQEKYGNPGHNLEDINVKLYKCFPRLLQLTNHSRNLKDDFISQVRYNNVWRHIKQSTF